MRSLVRSGVLLPILALLMRADEFSQDEKNMLRDTSGWEYVKISNPTGFQTEHPCFDGRPHPETCRGTLFLTPGSQFIKNIYVENKRDQRKGNYQLDGKSVLFFDEFGEQDGPYTVTLDMPNKSLILDKQGAHMELMLEKEYRKQMEQQKKEQKQ